MGHPALGSSSGPLLLVRWGGGGRLTLMSLDGQMEKLSALYAEKSDGELLDLYERRDGLTEMAQQALAGVMRERRLSAAADSGLGAVGEAEAVGAEAEDSVEEGEVLAYLFHDAFEAREAIRVMREAGIAHRMLDWHVVNPEMQVSQTGVDLGLVVGACGCGARGEGAEGAAGVVSGGGGCGARRRVRRWRCSRCLSAGMRWWRRGRWGWRG